MKSLQGLVAALLFVNGLYFLHERKKGLAYIDFAGTVLAILIALI